VASGLSQEELSQAAKDSDKVQAAIAGKDVVKVIAVPDKLVNIVVK
nr:leucyl-tRNA synthetase [Enterococcus faecalis]